MTDEKKDSKVSDIKPEAKADIPPPALPARDPTHWALPINTVQKIIRYLKKQPMEDVEEFVYAIQDERVPLGLAPTKKSS